VGQLFEERTLKFTTLSTTQLLIMTLLTGLIAGAISIGFSLYREYIVLPQVFKNPAGECIKVVNFVNGHAFACPDVNVLLRQYRIEVEKPQ
jgi:hypothetical protein